MKKKIHNYSRLRFCLKVVISPPEVRIPSHLAISLVPIVHSYITINFVHFKVTYLQITLDEVVELDKEL